MPTYLNVQASQLPKGEMVCAATIALGHEAYRRECAPRRLSMPVRNQELFVHQRRSTKVIAPGGWVLATGTLESKRGRCGLVPKSAVKPYISG